VLKKLSQITPGKAGGLMSETASKAAGLSWLTPKGAFSANVI